MTILAALIIIAGNLIGLYGFILLLVVVYKKSVLWLIACFLLPPFGIILFSILNYKDVLKPWALLACGLIMGAVGLQISPELRRQFEDEYSHFQPRKTLGLSELTRWSAE